MPMNVDPSLLQRLGRLEFLARQAVEGFITGLHKSPFHGFSVEFAEHRLALPPSLAHVRIEGWIDARGSGHDGLRDEDAIWLAL